MKIEDYKVGTSFITTAVLRTNKSDKVFFTAFGIDKKHAHYYSAKPDDVVDVKCTIIEEDVIIGDKYKDKNYDPNSVDYFALITWEDNDNLDVSLISPNIKVYNICFPYVIDEHLFYNKDVIKTDYKTLKTETTHRKGDRHRMTVRLKVENIKNFDKI